MRPTYRPAVKATVVVVLLFLSLASRIDAQSLGGGWATADIGASSGGSVAGSGGSFSVTGSGADIWGTVDAFRFLYTPLTGDGVVVAQVTSMQAAHDWTKGGVMIRETLTPGSRHAFMLVSANKGLAFQRRVNTNDITTHTAGAAAQAPAFVMLVRSGDTITASSSMDGASWTVVGVESISMAATVYVGVAVTSHSAGVLATANFDSVSAAALPPPAAVESRTLVFFRHGEKPAGGYGQLTCQGLQRALALPHVLNSRFGAPQFIFAPNPLPKVGDPAGHFSYVRPLATVEPTAIAAGLPVNAEYGLSDVGGVRAALLGPALGSSTVFIAWEHAKLVEIVQSIMDAFHSGVTVPAWTYGDYDSLYVVRLTNTNGVTTAQFDREYEGLNGLPTHCP